MRHRAGSVRLLGLALGATLLVCAMAAAAAESPAMPARAANVAGFLPAGWHIEQQYQADFNRDGLSDALLLLAPAQPVVEGQGQSPPRVLAVLLRERDGWVLAERNDRLVPRVDLSSQEDPLADGEIVLQPGGFRISLGLAATMGSYLAATLRYTFRLDGTCFRLIGYDRMEVHRATLDTKDLSIDFLSGVVLRSTGNAQAEAGKPTRERLSANPRRCLRDLGDAAAFKPL